MRRSFTACFVLIAAVVAINSAHAVRIKDIASVEGVRENQLVGYGLVIGLDGTGDDTDTVFTMQSLANALKKMGITVSPENIDADNVAAVIVTANLPPFVRVGETIDILVSSIGNSDSLQGGTLLQTPLLAPDGEIYAVAQGALSIGGFAVKGGGTSIQKNHPTVGVIMNGAMVEKNVPMDFTRDNSIALLLHNADFTTITRMQNAINVKFSQEIAFAQNASHVTIAIPQEFQDKIVTFISEIEKISVNPDTKARIILDERTGTVVMGEDVRISTIAVAHGNLSVQIVSKTTVSQPSPFSSGQTTLVTNTGIISEEEDDKLTVVPEGVSISEVVIALNAIGVTPRDLIAIFQAIKAAGALQAELKII